ncbi:platelet-activating factor receptor [Salvelinus alpinus]
MAEGSGAAHHHHQPCLLDPSSQSQRSFILVALCLVQGVFLLLLFSYCSVVRQPRHCSRSQHRSRQRTLTYWVLGVFLLCFVPYHLNLLGHTLTHVGLLPSCGLAQATNALHPVVLSLASSNRCLNPLIYYFSCSLVHREPNSSTGSCQ